jgi:hypothetical protein
MPHGLNRNNAHYKEPFLFKHAQRLKTLDQKRRIEKNAGNSGLSRRLYKQGWSTAAFD